MYFFQEEEEEGRLAMGRTMTVGVVVGAVVVVLDLLSCFFCCFFSSVVLVFDFGFDAGLVKGGRRLRRGSLSIVFLNKIKRYIFEMNCLKN